MSSSGDSGLATGPRDLEMTLKIHSHLHERRARAPVVGALRDTDEIEQYVGSTLSILLS